MYIKGAKGHCGHLMFLHIGATLGMECIYGALKGTLGT